MERFAKLIVVGGIALVAGLWIATLARPWSLPWLLGVGFVVLGIAGLARGIWSEIDY